MNAVEPLASELLTDAEVRALTGVADVDAQEKVLKGDGLPYRRRGKRVLVSRFHTREWLSGRTVAPSHGVNLALVR